MCHGKQCDGSCGIRYLYDYQPFVQPQSQCHCESDKIGQDFVKFGCTDKKVVVTKDGKQSLVSVSPETHQNMGPGPVVVHHADGSTSIVQKVEGDMEDVYKYAKKELTAGVKDVEDVLDRLESKGQDLRSSVTVLSGLISTLDLDKKGHNTIAMIIVVVLAALVIGVSFKH